MAKTWRHESWGKIVDDSKKHPEMRTTPFFGFGDFLQHTVEK